MGRGYLPHVQLSAQRVPRQERRLPIFPPAFHVSNTAKGRQKQKDETHHRQSPPDRDAGKRGEVVSQRCAGTMLRVLEEYGSSPKTTKALCGMRDPKALRHGRSCTIWNGESIAEWRSSRYAEDSEIKTSNMSGARIQDLSTSDLRRSQGHPGFSEHNLVFLPDYDTRGNQRPYSRPADSYA